MKLFLRLLKWLIYYILIYFNMIYEPIGYKLSDQVN